MRKKRVFLIAIFFLIVIGTGVGMMLKNNLNRIVFEDEAMGKLIAQSAGVNSVEELKEEDLEKVKMLNIGYTGYYDTLLDIGKCQQLDTLVIGCPEYTYCHYHRQGKEIPKPESKERIQQIEKELEEILKECPNLRCLYISNEDKNCKLDNLEFLKYGTELEVLRLEEQSIVDNEELLECKNLRYLSLYGSEVFDLSIISDFKDLKGLNLGGTNISTAEDILKLENLKYLAISNTPLAENKEELQLIYKEFSDIDIYKGEER